MLEPRCLVCGAPLGPGAPFEKEARFSEVCSDECFKVYMKDDVVQDDGAEEQEGGVT